MKTEGLPDYLKARIEEKAQQGQTALIRYLNSTRHIHNLRACASRTGRKRCR